MSLSQVDLECPKPGGRSRSSALNTHAEVSSEPEQEPGQKSNIERGASAKEAAHTPAFHTPGPQQASSPFAAFATEAAAPTAAADPLAQQPLSVGYSWGQGPGEGVSPPKEPCALAGQPMRFEPGATSSGDSASIAHEPAGLAHSSHRQEAEAQAEEAHLCLGLGSGTGGAEVGLNVGLGLRLRKARGPEAAAATAAATNGSARPRVVSAA